MVVTMTSTPKSHLVVYLFFLLPLISCKPASGSGSPTLVSTTVLAASIDPLDAGRKPNSLKPPLPVETTYEYDVANATSLSHIQLLRHRLGRADRVRRKVHALRVQSLIAYYTRYSRRQIYKAFPDIHSVVHGHTSEVLPIAAAGVPLKAQLHTAGSIGTHGTPIFDARKLPPNILPDNQLHDILIRDSKLGAALAGTFIPDSQIVLMTHHGLAIRAPSIQDAVFRAFYARQDAIVTLQTIHLLGVQAGRNGGNFGLTPREASYAEETTESDSLIGRSWQLWTRQVANVNPGLYVNDFEGRFSRSRVA